MTLNKRPVEQMLIIIRERADEQWPALYQQREYTQLMDILAKPTEEITYAEKVSVGDALRLFCLCLGLDYYRLLMRVHGMH